MPNTYFQFKQFRVEQDKCAMKVCTDSCVFGAAVEVADAQRVLDIGAGTGLLSLMVAQRTKATIDAVEINQEAQVQAAENFSSSPWRERLHLHPVSLQKYAESCQVPYDIILSNPPFFLSSLKSPDAVRNTAKHAGELLFDDILLFAQQHLNQNGKLYLLLPPAEATLFRKLALAHGFKLAETIEVFTYRGGKCIRHIQTYTVSAPEAPATKQFFIREEDKVTYTAEFATLLREYYLQL
ncbi:methyltransferase domain-containing protein [Pontibacter diazotrophicus]|uniref:tRNA1(Val) (adenine(37)-N6)-methyltransferase n=1 Tax=Pontibacter diazotrophicus TaxID=1400979 RepID=A0A3D8LF38_9BACT|nr:methyltransferase [Pontibacter diazotrophicus]RDV16061.1 methyltransferase domain-containing protein [Pontibacter diazotrophicus]